MADIQTVPLQLQWGRGPTGQFSIIAVVPVGNGSGIPWMVWALSVEEEAGLREAVNNGTIVVARDIPQRPSLSIVGERA